MRRATYILAAILTCLAALIWAPACSRQSTANTEGQPLNVVLITLDSVRADRLGYAGHTNAFTPVLNGLAQNGTQFTALQSVTPMPLPAMASILTGLQPPEHGLRVPGGGPLNAGIPTLTTALKSQGYSTGAFLADNEGLEHSQLKRGFDIWNIAPDSGATTARPRPVAPRLRPRAFPRSRNYGVRRGEEVCGSALNWLGSALGVPKPAKPSLKNAQIRRGAGSAAPAKLPGTNSAKTPVPKLKRKHPFFLWMHLADEKFAGTPEQTRAQGRRGMDSHDAELAYMDLQIGRVVSFLNQYGLRENTLIAVVGLRGAELSREALDDPALSLSDEMLLVPGLLAGGDLTAAKLESRLNQTCLAPTIARLADPRLNLHPAAAARALERGESGRLTAPPAGPVYSETLWPHHAYGLQSEIRWVTVPAAVATGAEKDADDAADGVDASAVIEAAKRSLDLSLAAPAPPPLASASIVLPEGVPRAEFVTLWQRVARRMRAPSAKDETLLEDCQRLAATVPDSALFSNWLGIAHLLRKQPAEAMAAFEKAASAAPRSAHIIANMGLAQLEAGDIPKAIDKLEDAYLLDPEDAEYANNLALVLMNTGMALARNGEYNDAMACMTRVLLLQPNNPVAHVNLGAVYQGMGRGDLAAASFRKALEINPNFAPAKRALQAANKKQSDPSAP